MLNAWEAALEPATVRAIRTSSFTLTTDNNLVKYTGLTVILYQGKIKQRGEKYSEKSDHSLLSHFISRKNKRKLHEDA